MYVCSPLRVKRISRDVYSGDETRRMLTRHRKYDLVIQIRKCCPFSIFCPPPFRTHFENISKTFQNSILWFPIKKKYIALRESHVNANLTLCVRFFTFFREDHDLHRYHLSTWYIIPALALPAGIRWIIRQAR